MSEMARMAMRIIKMAIRMVMIVLMMLKTVSMVIRLIVRIVRRSLDTFELSSLPLPGLGVSGRFGPKI